MDFFSSQQVFNALVSLFVGGLLGREIFRIIDKPKVVIQYEALTVFRQHDGVYLSIRVGNVGRNAAERCYCTLTIFDLHKDQILDMDSAHAHENLPEYKEESLDLDYPRYQIIQRDSLHDIVSESLCWSSLGNPPSISINPGTAQSMDICKYFRNEYIQYFIFPSEFGWRKVRVRLSSEKEIRGRLLVCPANDFPTALDFELSICRGEPTFKASPPPLATRFRRTIWRESIYKK